MQKAKFAYSVNEMENDVSYLTSQTKVRDCPCKDDFLLREAVWQQPVLLSGRPESHRRNTNPKWAKIQICKFTNSKSQKIGRLNWKTLKWQAQDLCGLQKGRG